MSGNSAMVPVDIEDERGSTYVVALCVVCHELRKKFAFSPVHYAGIDYDRFTLSSLDRSPSM
jgi:hypothetical protein